MKCTGCGAPGLWLVRHDGDSAAYCEACAERHLKLESFPVLRRMRGSRVAGPQSCPNCGWDRERFSQTGMLGCPLCYVVLEPEILAGFADA